MEDLSKENPMVKKKTEDVPQQIAPELDAAPIQFGPDVTPTVVAEPTPEPAPKPAPKRTTRRKR